MLKYGNLLMACAACLSLLFLGCSTADKEMKAADGPEMPAPAMAEVKVSEFVLGVGDTLDISVFRHDELKRTVKLDPSGKLMFPLINDIQAAGRDIYVVRDDIKNRLSKYIVDPQVSISVSTILSQKVLVLGEVKTPGIFTLDSSLSIMDAVAKAGGFTDDAKKSDVILINRNTGKAEIASFDMGKALKGDISADRMLRNGDIVYVPAAGIADVSWFFNHLSKILSPVVNLESGIVLWPQVKEVFEHGSATSSTPLSIPTTR